MSGDEIPYLNCLFKEEASIIVKAFNQRMGFVKVDMLLFTMGGRGKLTE